ncbi:nucleoside-diphosphate-sugar epimerase [Paraburkholderia atlantica]
MNEASMSSPVAKQLFRTLVTGANGFTGRYLVEKLSGRGHTVIEAVWGRVSLTRRAQHTPRRRPVDWIRSINGVERDMSWRFCARFVLATA